MATSPYVFYSNCGYSGVPGITSGNYIDIFSDIAAATSEVQALKIQHNFGGTGMTGPRNSLEVWSHMNAPTSNTTDAMRQYTAAQFTMFANSSDGGTAPTPGHSGGFVFAMDSQLIVASTATNLSGAYAVEFDLDISAGATFQRAIGLLIEVNNGAAGNDGVDSAIAIGGGQNSNLGLDFGICFGNGGSSWIIKSTGTILGGFSQSKIYTQGGSLDTQGIPPVASLGIDFSTVRFTGSAWSSPGVKINNTSIALGGAALTATSSNVTLDVPGYTSSGVTINSGGPGSSNPYFVGDLIYSPYGGMYEVTSVSSGVITGLSLITPDSATSIPSNPVSTTGGSGAFATVNISWPNTASRVLALNPSGGDVQVGSGAAIATSSTQGFLKVPFMDGTPTGTPANSDGPAFVWNDMTKILNIWSPSAGTWYHIAATAGAG